MVYAFFKISGFKKHQVVGMAGALDSTRFKTFIAMETGYSVQDVSCMVLGGHGDSMVPITRLATVGGVPVTDLISKSRLNEIENRTRVAGGEIVKLFGNGSAFYAPAASGVEMAKAYLNDEKKLLPCAAYLNGEYGIKDIYAGVPIIIGKNGVEKIEEINLDEKEKSEFLHSIDAVKKLWEAASKIDPDLA